MVSLPVGPPRSFHNSLHTQLHVPSLFKKKNQTKSNQKKTKKVQACACMRAHAQTHTKT